MQAFLCTLVSCLPPHSLEFPSFNKFLSCSKVSQRWFPASVVGNQAPWLARQGSDAMIGGTNWLLSGKWLNKCISQGPIRNKSQ